MKRIAILCALLATTAFAQSRHPVSESAVLLHTITNWTNSTSSATGYVAVPVKAVLTASEVDVIIVATDSIQKTLTFAGANSAFTSTIFSGSYVDSISSWNDATVPTATAPETKVVTLKGRGVDRLAGCDNFKITVSGGAAGAQGTSTGRTIKVYLRYVF
jgi:hypothetical protein